MPAITVPTALLAHAAHAHGVGDPNVSLLVLAALPFLAGAVLLTRSQEATTSTVALFSAAAGFIHAVVTPEHFHEDPAAGLFTLAVTGMQMAVVVAGLNRPSRALWLASAAGNAAVLAIWTWSRTAGLPVGPDPGMAEPVGVLDLTCAAYEVAIVAGSLILAGRRGLLMARHSGPEALSAGPVHWPPICDVTLGYRRLRQYVAGVPSITVSQRRRPSAGWNRTIPAHHTRSR